MTGVPVLPDEGYSIGEEGASDGVLPYVDPDEASEYARSETG